MTLQLSVAVAAAWPTAAAVSVVVLLQLLLPVAVVEQQVAAVGSSAFVVEIVVAVEAESLNLAATAGSSTAICWLLFHQEPGEHLGQVEWADHLDLSC